MKLPSYRNNSWYACLCLAGCWDIVHRCRCRVIKSHFFGWGLRSRQGGMASLFRCWGGGGRASRRFHFFDSKDLTTSPRDSGHMLHLPHLWCFLDFHFSRRGEKEESTRENVRPCRIKEEGGRGKEVAGYEPHVTYILIFNISKKSSSFIHACSILCNKSCLQEIIKFHPPRPGLAQPIMNSIFHKMSQTNALPSTPTTNPMTQNSACHQDSSARSIGQGGPKVR